MNIFESLFGDCYICGAEIHKYGLCDLCKNQLMYNDLKCVLCHNICIHKDYQCFVPYFYNQIIASILMQIKYYDNIHIAKWIANEIGKKIKDSSKNDMYTVTFVPTSRGKLFNRTYNQAQLIAYELAKINKYKYDPFIFQKTKTTSQQYANFDQRHKNATFIELYKPQFYPNLIIIDDLIASGATILRCYSLIKNFYNAHDYQAEVSIAALAKSL